LDISIGEYGGGSSPSFTFVLVFSFLQNRKTKIFQELIISKLKIAVTMQLFISRVSHAAQYLYNLIDKDYFIQELYR
jgi:hypothetical protein